MQVEKAFDLPCNDGILSTALKIQTYDNPMDIKHKSPYMIPVATLTSMLTCIFEQEIFSREGTSQKNCGSFLEPQKDKEKVPAEYEIPKRLPRTQETATICMQTSLFMMAS
jgi:hypothetical protein